MPAKEKEEYNQLCASEAGIPPFFRPWWLDAICGENNWDVALVKKNGIIVAILPYYMVHKLGGTLIMMPPLTHIMGTWIKYPENQKYTRRLSFEMEVMSELIDKLPMFSFFYQHFDHSTTNWLPFYWRGFKQTTHYTYVCENIKDTNVLWGDLKSKVRTEIKKARKSGLSIIEETNFDVLWTLVTKTWERQSKKSGFKRSDLESVYKASYNRNSGKLMVVYDLQKNPCAALFYIWTKDTAYFLTSGADPELRNQGATTLLYWESMLDAAKVSDCVNFCGSMKPTIGLLLRGLGTRQKPYFVITKDQRPALLKAARSARDTMCYLGGALRRGKKSS
ncbi:MAG: GNAT family N-acetyltransferase [Planctomycetota bacterium]|jgi:hypothetical protein